MLNGRPQVRQMKATSESLSEGRASVAAPAPVQKRENHTGLPARLKEGIESLSGLALDDVRVHHNSDRPAQLQALAYAQGTEIHLGPGQERHLPHKAWHVVQQKQGRVKPTVQMKGIAVNADSALEREAESIGARVARVGAAMRTVRRVSIQPGARSPVQRTNGSGSTDANGGSAAPVGSGGATPAAAADGALAPPVAARSLAEQGDILGVISGFLSAIEAHRLRAIATIVGARVPIMPAAMMVEAIDAIQAALVEHEAAAQEGDEYIHFLARSRQELRAQKRSHTAAEYRELKGEIYRRVIEQGEKTRQAMAQLVSLFRRLDAVVADPRVAEARNDASLVATGQLSAADFRRRHGVTGHQFLSAVTDIASTKMRIALCRGRMESQIAISRTIGAQARAALG